MVNGNHNLEPIMQSISLTDNPLESSFDSNFEPGIAAVSVKGITEILGISLNFFPYYSIP